MGILRRFAVPAAVLVLLVPLSVAATDEAGTEEDASFDDIVLHLEELIVTAQKRPEDVQTVPVSVSTISRDQFDVLTGGAEDIRALRARVPNLHIESSFGRTFPRLYLRGYGNTDFDLNTSQPVSFLVDDVVQENVMLKSVPLFDVEQIEILRGPQGTLFGRNTPAGTVKVDSRRPGFDREIDVRLTGGTLGTVDFEGAFNFPLTNAWAGRVSTLYQRRDDWIDNDFPGAPRRELGGFDQSAVRVQLLYQGESLGALFNVHGSSLDGTARIFHANSIQPGTNDLVDGFEADTVYHDGDNTQELDTAGGFVQLSWPLGRGTLTSITAFESADVFSRGDIDGGYGAEFAPPSGPGVIPFPSETAAVLKDHSQWSHETRWAREEWGRCDFQAGLFYFDEEYTIDSISYDSLSGGVQDGLARQTQSDRAWALFGTVEYHLTDQTTLRAGARYSDEEKDFVAARLASPLGPVGPLRANPSDTDVSWDVSARHQLAENVGAYVRIATGFRAPSIQGRLLFGDTLSVAESETILSYEAGFKSILAGERMRLNASVFDYSVKDQQITAVGGEANFNRLINVHETGGRGFELELQALVTSELEIQAGVGWVDTEIDDPSLAVQPCGGGCTVLDPAGPVEGTVLIDGNPLPQAPEWTANLVASYRRAVGPGEIRGVLDWYYRDEVDFFLYEAAEFRGGALSELGLRVSYGWGAHEVALIGRNVTDETEIVGGVDFNNLTAFVNDPRVWAIRYGVRF